MLLNDLVEALHEKTVIGVGNPDICSLVYDSRTVTRGSIFVCIRGADFDGHLFAADAVSKGARAVVADDEAQARALSASVPVVLVPDVRAAMPVLANRFFGYPSRKLKLIGVTGTNGKTTTTYLVESILRSAGIDAGVVGTLGSRIRGELIPSDRTTPESVDLQALFARMVDERLGAVAMEVSSHALAKGRTHGTEFDVGVFTNLTLDHLDFHHTLGEYLDAKLTLFRDYPRRSEKPFTAVVNIDDPRGKDVIAATHGAVITYGVHEAADIRASEITASAEGVSYSVSTPAGNTDIELHLGGLFQVYNSLGAIGAGLALGVGLDGIRAGLEEVSSVDGRFESVRCGQDFSVIVDYAHTPDGLENVLRSGRSLTSGRLIVVFGCGGDRDRTKRPIMGRMASEMSDVCIVTSDNPRTEDPDSIVREILTGINGDHRAEVMAITDRRTAIAEALSIARAGDLVLIPGKGHETYQILGRTKIHFDDREVVREILCCR